MRVVIFHDHLPVIKLTFIRTQRPARCLGRLVRQALGGFPVAVTVCTTTRVNRIVGPAEEIVPNGHEVFHSLLHSLSEYIPSFQVQVQVE